MQLGGVCSADRAKGSSLEEGRAGRDVTSGLPAFLCACEAVPENSDRMVRYSQAMDPVRGASFRLKWESQWMSRRVYAWTNLLVVGLLVVAGCSRSPEAKKARYLEHG